jgi:hypothetical protein
MVIVRLMMMMMMMTQKMAEMDVARLGNGERPTA